MSIVAVGVDIASQARIQKTFDRFGHRFINRILHPSELRETVSSAYLCRQFAAKEAVAKALGTGMGAGISFRQIVVLRKKSGAPFVEFHGAARERAEHLGIQHLHISLSDEKDHAVAFAVAEN